MKNFLQWVESNGLELPVIDTADKKPATSENTKRTGLSGNYPPQYVAGQYPDGYFPPIKATAALDLKNMKKR